MCVYKMYEPVKASQPSITTSSPHHICKHTGNVDTQDSPEDVRQRRVHETRRRDRVVDELALAVDAQRIEDKEEIVARPQQLSRDFESGCKRYGEEAVPHDFGRAPRDQHADVFGRPGCLACEVVDDAPYEQETAGDLHQGGQKRSSDNTYECQ